MAASLKKPSVAYGVSLVVMLAGIVAGAYVLRIVTGLEAGSSAATLSGMPIVFFFAGTSSAVAGVVREGWRLQPQQDLREAAITNFAATAISAVAVATLITTAGDQLERSSAIFWAAAAVVLLIQVAAVLGLRRARDRRA